MVQSLKHSGNKILNEATSHEAIYDATKHCHPPTRIPNRVAENQATESHHHTHHYPTNINESKIEYTNTQQD
jgi:hypothetical protein